MKKLLLTFASTVLLASGFAGSAKAAAPEIVELARALSNNPDQIYQYVYNNIQTLPQYGSLKGPLGALLDGKGTSYDQAELMFQLLQQAGYSPSFQFGQVDLTGAQLSNWLGTDTSFNSIAVTTGSGGFSGTINTSGGTVTDATLGWAWIAVPINGTTYIFDPSTKVYNRSTGLSTLATALGYSQSTFLSHAQSGATFGTASVSGLNRTNIRNDMTTYANNLVNYIKTNNPTAKTSDIIGGVSIQQIPSTTILRQTTLPYASGEFDLIISISILTHLSEHSQELLLSELFRTARPGAVLLLTVHGERAMERVINEPKIWEMLAPRERKIAMVSDCWSTRRFAIKLAKNRMRAKASKVMTAIGMVTIAARLLN